jgi:hypothetical protein
MTRIRDEAFFERPPSLLHISSYFGKHHCGILCCRIRCATRCQVRTEINCVCKCPLHAPERNKESV